MKIVGEFETERLEETQNKKTTTERKRKSKKVKTCKKIKEWFCELTIKKGPSIDGAVFNNTRF